MLKRRAQQDVMVAEEGAPGAAPPGALFVHAEPGAVRHVDRAGHDRVGAHVVGRQGCDALPLLLDLRIGDAAAPGSVQQTEV